MNTRQDWSTKTIKTLKLYINMILKKVFLCGNICQRFCPFLVNFDGACCVFKRPESSCVCNNIIAVVKPKTHVEQYKNF